MTHMGRESHPSRHNLSRMVLKKTCITDIPKMSGTKSQKHESNELGAVNPIQMRQTKQDQTPRLLATMNQRSMMTCTVWSIVKFDESTVCASCAGTSGATVRCVSRASRSLIS